MKIDGIEIKDNLDILVIVGPTASGKTALSIKLAKELSKRSTGKTLFILDEPTTGLHFDDVNKLLKITTPTKGLFIINKKVKNKDNTVKKLISLI